MKMLLQCGRVALGVLMALLIVGALQPLMAADDPIILLEPYQAENAAWSASSEQIDHAYIKRRGNVLFQVPESLSAKSTASPHDVGEESETGKAGLAGTKMLISFFEDARFTVTVDGENHTPGNGFSLQGRQEGAPFSSFSLTVAGDSYIISFQDINSGMVYRAVGSADTGIGTVKEIDPVEIPPIYDSEPIVPPQR